MINRYEGNTGRVTRMPEPQDLPPPPKRRAPPRHTVPPAEAPGSLLPGLGEGFETEDVLLLLILWLLYRESGDQELLIILGAMFLL